MKNIIYLVAVMLFAFGTTFGQFNDMTKEGDKKQEGTGMQDLAEPEEELEIIQKTDGSLERPKNHDEAMKYFKEKYYEEIDGVYFEDVWNAVVESLSDQGCELMTKVQKDNDEGFLKGVLKSEFCVFCKR